MTGLPKNNSFHLLSILLIVLSCLAAYFISIQGTFIWDDQHFIVHNNTIKNPQFWPKLFLNNIATGSYFPYRYYRPLQELTYMIDYSLWELKPMGYHITNITLHTLVGLSLYWFIVVLTQQPLIARLTTLFYAVHPIQIEAVAYISGRGDPLCALFILLSFIIYLEARPINLIRGSLLFILSLLALLSKENGIVLPILILGYHFFYRTKFEVRKFVPVLSSVFVYILWRMFFVVSKPEIGSQLKGAGERIPGFFDAFFNYFTLLIFPYPLRFSHGQKLFSIMDGTVILGIILFIFLIITALRCRKNIPLIGFSIFWFVVALLPYSNIYLIYNYMADHHLYISSIGYFLILSFLASHIPGKQGKGLFLKKIIVALIFTSYMSLTILQNINWINPVIFYKHILSYDPDNFFCHNNLGTVYTEQGNWEEAKKHLLKAVSLNTKRAYKAYDALGVVDRKEGDFDKALLNFKKSIELKPDFIVAYNNLGLIYFEMKNYDEALVYLKKSVTINQNNDTGFYLLGLTYYKLNQDKMAEEALREAIQINPSHKQAWFHLALLKKFQGDLRNAQTILKEGLKNREEFDRALTALQSIQR